MPAVAVPGQQPRPTHNEGYMDRVFWTLSQSEPCAADHVVSFCPIEPLKLLPADESLLFLFLACERVFLCFFCFFFWLQLQYAEQFFCLLPITVIRPSFIQSFLGIQYFIIKMYFVEGFPLLLISCSVCSWCCAVPIVFCYITILFIKIKFAMTICVSTFALEQFIAELT